MTQTLPSEECVFIGQKSFQCGCFQKLICKIPAQVLVALHVFDKSNLPRKISGALAPVGEQQVTASQSHTRMTPDSLFTLHIKSPELGYSSSNPLPATHEPNCRPCLSMQKEFVTNTFLIGLADQYSDGSIDLNKDTTMFYIFDLITFL